MRRLVTVTILGNGFDQKAYVTFSPTTGITILSLIFISPGELRVNIGISKDAPIGSRDVVVTNSNQQSGTLKGGFTVQVAPAVPGNITLTPGKAENPVSTEHKLIAAVLDTAKKPMAGVKVTFIVTGANPVTGIAVTDGAGQAYFSYYGAKPGDDTITATVDKLTATAYKRWHPKVSEPAPPTLPDLYLSKIICDKQEKRIGYVIENRGTAIAPSGHITALLQETMILDSHTVEVSLTPGQSYEAYFQNFEFYTTIEITVISDYENAILEISEDNNSGTKRCEFEVLHAPALPLPDLIVHPSHPVSYRSDTYGEVGFYYTIWNRGAAPAPSSRTVLYIDGINMGTAGEPSLEPGESRSESFPAYWDCTLGDEGTIEIVVDSYNNITEESELNNHHVATLTCSVCTLPRVDLAVRDVRLSFYKVTYMLHNCGAAESPETTAHLLIEGEEVETQPIARLEGGDRRREQFEFEYRGTCTERDDRVTVWVEPVSYIVRDPSGVDVGLGELDTLNNRVTEVWECEGPDLRITNADCSGSRCQYTISNDGNDWAFTSTTSLYVYDDEGTRVVVHDEVGALREGESRDETVELDYMCVAPGHTIAFTADINNVIAEIDEDNNGYTYYWHCAPAPDLAIEYLGIPGYENILYRITNVGNARFPSPATITVEYASPTELSPPAPVIVLTEPELDMGGTRQTYIEIPYIWCGRGKQVTVTATATADWDVNTANNAKTVTFDNMCANFQQDPVEDGIDCGGWCPNSCFDCFANAAPGSAEDSGYFDLYSEVVRNTALQALQEYANCLRDPTCRGTLLVTDRSADFSSITADDLRRSPDYIMEAVAWYVDKHTEYMTDDECDICDRELAISAEDMIQRSGEVEQQGGKGTQPCFQKCLQLPLQHRLPMRI